ncbi:MAG: hydrogenase small subunit [Spirochaetales bacterium]|nr:hydrogenase small subunit [Spirochaetales bacterium]
MKFHTITRRQFIKMVSGGIAALGLSPRARGSHFFPPALSKKPAVVWLEAQDCAGCTESVLSCLSPDIRPFLLDTVAVRYHETVMAAEGVVAESALEAAIEEGGYVLVVEGSIPAFDARFCMVGGKSVEETFIRAAQKAVVIIAIGACASYGGIPRAGVTGGQSVSFFLARHGIGKTLINLPGCPCHPLWFYDTVADFLEGSVISLDAYKRPLRHFRETIHDNCPRRPRYNANKFLEDWNNPMERESYCLLHKGCKGYTTYGDCPLIKWNDGVNYCTANGAPCSGCTEPRFYDELSPLYTGEK